MGQVTLEVVGVMKDGKYGRLDSPPEPYFCLPMSQDKFEKRFYLVVRTAGEPRSMMRPVQEEIRKMDPNLPVSNTMTMTQFLEYSLIDAKATAALVGIFGLVALILAMVGVYSMMSFYVSQRTQELGLRIALGASRPEILRMVLDRGMKLTLIGVGVGLVLAFGMTRVLSALLFGLSTLDPLVFAIVPLLLSGIAAVACYFPARWATAVDPISVLRYE
jgi:ABC-type antimicrobial peptide transport system permease subunit